MGFGHISNDCGHCLWNFLCQAEVNFSHELSPDSPHPPPLREKTTGSET